MTSDDQDKRDNPNLSSQAENVSSDTDTSPLEIDQTPVEDMAPPVPIAAETINSEDVPTEMKIEDEQAAPIASAPAPAETTAPEMASSPEIKEMPEDVTNGTEKEETPALHPSLMKAEQQQLKQDMPTDPQPLQSPVKQASDDEAKGDGTETESTGLHPSLMQAQIKQAAPAAKEVTSDVAVEPETPSSPQVEQSSGDNKSEETSGDEAASIHPSLMQAQRSVPRPPQREDNEAALVTPPAVPSTEASAEDVGPGAGEVNSVPAEDDFDDISASEEMSDIDEDFDVLDDDLQGEIDAVSELTGDVSDEYDDVDMDNSDGSRISVAAMSGKLDGKAKLLGGGVLAALLVGGAFMFMDGDETIPTKPVKVAERPVAATQATNIEQQEAQLAEAVVDTPVDSGAFDTNVTDAGVDNSDAQLTEVIDTTNTDAAVVMPVADQEEDDVLVQDNVATEEAPSQVMEETVAEAKGRFEAPDVSGLLPDVADIDESGFPLAAEEKAPLQVADASESTTSFDTEINSQVDLQIFKADLPQPTATRNKIGRFEPRRPDERTLTQPETIPQIAQPQNVLPPLPQQDVIQQVPQQQAQQPQIQQVMPTPIVPEKPAGGRTLLSEDSQAQDQDIEILPVDDVAVAEEVDASPSVEENGAVSGVLKGSRGGEGQIDSSGSAIDSAIAEFFDSGSDQAGASPFSSIRKVDPDDEPASRFVIVKKQHEASAEESLLVSANRALQLKRYDSALDMFDALYKRNDRDPRVLMGLGVAQQNTGRFDSAFRTYEQVLEVDPDNKEALLNMMGLLKDKYPAVALRRLSDLREKHPDNAAIVAQIGLVSAKMGDYQSAMRHLGIAASLEPRNATHVFNMAIVADRQRQTQTAIELYQRALEVDSIHRLGAVPRDTIYDRLSKLRRRL